MIRLVRLRNEGRARVWHVARIRKDQMMTVVWLGRLRGLWMSGMTPRLQPLCAKWWAYAQGVPDAEFMLDMAFGMRGYCKRCAAALEKLEVR